MLYRVTCNTDSTCTVRQESKGCRNGDTKINIVETCEDISSTVDAYVARLKDLRAGGTVLEGIGLEGHFSKPNIPYMRAVLDKLATLNLPIWFTKVNINNKFDAQTQAVYLEQVLWEAYAHPAVSGVMLWTALHQSGCYQMCLTD
jgi:GH35 family endo-1,4-beta-xylanase